MKPASPYEVRDRGVFKPTERCGQGPYRLETDSLRAKFGERLVVYACGNHSISGNYRMTTKREKRKDDVDESAFGFDRDNAACKVREGAAATVVASGGGGGGGGGAAGGAARGGATASAPATIAPVTLVAATDVPADCVRTGIVNMSWYSTEDHVPLEGRVVVDVWSDEPNDLEGLVFVVERSAVAADMTLERWKAYQAADDAYRLAMNAFVEGEVHAGRSHYVDTTVKTPPPPAPRAETPPPKPSKNARWIAGYWIYAEAKFHWIAGMWDVPESDLQQELTVQAPKPPPPEPVVVEQPKGPQPTTTAVWTPGSWQWNGTAYVWIEGAWRIPPDAQHTWQRPTWTVRTGRAIYIPGGWRVRVRLR